MMTCWWQCDVQPGAGRSLPPTDVGPGAANSSWPSTRRCLTGRLLSCDEHANSPIGVLSRPTLRLTMPNCGWVPVTAACSSSLPYQSQQGGASGGRLDDSDQERHEVERATCGLALRCCISTDAYLCPQRLRRALLHRRSCDDQCHGNNVWASPCQIIVVHPRDLICTLRRVEGNGLDGDPVKPDPTAVRCAASTI